jgi:hypothetical protein
VRRVSALRFNHLRSPHRGLARGNAADYDELGACGGAWPRSCARARAAGARAWCMSRERQLSGAQAEDRPSVVTHGRRGGLSGPWARCGHVMPLRASGHAGAPGARRGSRGFGARRRGVLTWRSWRPARHGWRRRSRPGRAIPGPTSTCARRDEAFPWSGFDIACRATICGGVGAYARARPIGALRRRATGPVRRCGMGGWRRPRPRTGRAH